MPQIKRFRLCIEKIMKNWLKRIWKKIKDSFKGPKIDNKTAEQVTQSIICADYVTGL